MEKGSCNIIGIGLSEEDAAVRPSARVETSITEISAKTAGKIFVGIEVTAPGPVTFGMEVDGQTVPIVDNEKRGQTDLVPTPGRFESYAFDLPMRIIGDENQNFPATHKVRILWGHMGIMGPEWVDAAEFDLVITGTGPVVGYDPVKDGD
jgi:hypothetical protein